MRVGDRVWVMNRNSSLMELVLTTWIILNGVNYVDVTE